MEQRELKIIGILHDFVHDNAFASAAAPLVMYGAPEGANYMTIRLRAGADVGDALQKVGGVMTELLTGRLTGIFTVLAIFISCLGLFGLAAYSAARRAKEIGIRKVLGASAPGLATLLSRDFLKWVLVSCGIAVPAGWWVMRAWLQDYDYRNRG